MSKWILSGWLVFILIALGFELAFAQPGTLGFSAWKQRQIEEARMKIEAAKKKLEGPEVKSSSLGKGNEGAEGESAKSLGAGGEPDGFEDDHSPGPELQQAELNFEVAKELSIVDYFVLYLRPLGGRDSFLEAAKQLTPEEVADLMVAYQKHLGNPEQIKPLVAPPSAVCTPGGDSLARGVRPRPTL